MNCTLTDLCPFFRKRGAAPRAYLIPLPAIKRKKKNSERKVNILYGIPAESISGILVGREYEKNKEVLKELRELFPHVYICNLDGLIIID